MLHQRSRCPRTSAPDRCVGNAGTTIVELLIASSILLIVLLATFSSFESVSTSAAYQADRTKVLGDMRGTLNRLTRDLRQASAIDEAASTASTITYTTPINGVHTEIVYTASGTTLTRKVGTASPFTVLTGLATTSVFSYVSADASTGVQWVEMNIRVIPARLPSTVLVLDSEVNLRNRTTDLTGTS